MMGDSDRRTIADAFNRDLDPLAKYAQRFDSIEIDPFDLYINERLSKKDLTKETIDQYNRSFRQWKEFMYNEERHFACPNKDHVTRFINYLQEERGNAAGTIKNRLMYLNQAYKYWQDDAAFPHPHDYNPIDLAKKTADLSDEPQKKLRRLTVSELSDKLQEITNIRDQAFVLIQLKLGLRASEVCNIKISEIHLSNTVIEDHYSEMGTTKPLDGRRNAIYIPHDRERNKSRKPRVLPLDYELRQVLLKYILIRPDINEPWLFLSKVGRQKLRYADINKVWKNYFHPEYAENERFRAVTSHYGRHRFTTYWRVEQDLSRELVKYMRGDTPGGSKLENLDVMDEYIHTYYEDIETIYREQIYQFGL